VIRFYLPDRRPSLWGDHPIAIIREKGEGPIVIKSSKNRDMPIQLNEHNEGRTVAVHVSGKLLKEDYEHFVPEFDRLAALHGKLRVLFDMTDFHGWTPGAMWEDTKFAMHHFSNIKRLAIVGEKKWQEGMATFCKPFTKAAVKYFDHTDAVEARAWVDEVPAS
jgi:hypothetical protein